MWAESLGSEATHRAVIFLRLQLALLAFAAAATWCVANLYLVYRSVGSVQIPRRLGNLEIDEVVPRRYLLVGSVAVGILAALWVSRGAAGWWDEFSLLGGSDPQSLRDPLLERSVAYYLFTLPWLTELHSFLLRLAATGVVLVVLLYMATGAVRKEKNGIAVADYARRHIAVLLASCAAALFFGFRLDPEQYVAGVHPVPYDGILSGVRIPASRALAALSLVTAAGSLAWIWLDRVALVGASWGLLLAGVFVGRYAAPAFAAAEPGRTRIDPETREMQRRTLAIAYGLDGEEVWIDPPSVPDRRTAAAHREELVSGVLWDGPMLVDFLNRRVALPQERFNRATLAVAGNGDRQGVPVFIAVGEGERASGNLGARVFALVAGAATDSGSPWFIRDWKAPRHWSVEPAELALSGPVRFTDAAVSFSVLPDTAQVKGVALQGIGRRLALAWVLQSTSLLRKPAGEGASVVVWRRAAGERLERYAPFASFGRPYSAIAGGRLYWLAEGYVSSRTFPFSVSVRWRGRQVRYLRAPFLGVVDAHSGATAVFRVAEDPLGAEWARLAPDVVRSRSELPVELRAQLRYPEELFRIQLALHQRDTSSTLPVARDEQGFGEPVWLIASSPGDPVRRLRLRGAVEAGDPPRLVTVADGALVGQDQRFSSIRLASSWPGSTSSALEGERVTGARFGGQVRTYLHPDLLAFSRTWYSVDGRDGAPRVRLVTLHLGVAVGRGVQLEQAFGGALESLRSAADRDASWRQLKEWFDRMDAARAAGDWVEFGRAYEEIGRLLRGIRDTVR
jgi:hypothetical protein